METLYSSQVSTPLGHLLILATAQGICGLDFLFSCQREPAVVRLRKYFKAPVFSDDENNVIYRIKGWLAAYFAKDFENLLPPPLDLRGTKFELAVWRALLNIPLGQTKSYGEIAEKIGRPKAARAVGGACHRNPVALIIPCHRVVGADGKLNGFAGGLDVKAWLLEHEQCHKLREESRQVPSPELMVW